MTKRLSSIAIAIAATMALAGCGDGPHGGSSTGTDTGWRWGETISRDKSIQSRDATTMTVTMPLSYLVAEAMADYVRQRDYAMLGNLIVLIQRGWDISKVKLDTIVDYAKKMEQLRLVERELRKIRAQDDLEDDVESKSLDDKINRALAKLPPDARSRVQRQIDARMAEMTDDRVKRTAVYAIALEAFRPRGTVMVDCEIYYDYMLASELANLLAIDIVSHVHPQYQSIDDIRRQLAALMDAYPADRLDGIYRYAKSLTPGEWVCNDMDTKITILTAKDMPVQYEQSGTGWTIRRYGNVVFGDGKVGGSEYKVAMEHGVSVDIAKRATSTQSTETGGAAKSDATAPAK